MKKHSNAALIVVPIGIYLSLLLVLAMVNGRGWIDFPPLALSLAILTALNGVVAVIFGRFIHDKNLAVLGSIIATELILILIQLYPFAFRAKDSPHDDDNIWILGLVVAAIVTLPLLIPTSIGFVRLGKTLFTKNTTKTVES